MTPVKTGIAELPLHSGHAPIWLIEKMKKLADAIVSVIVDSYDTGEFLRRVSDPLWFQSFGCVLGFDWHSSGLTTVVTGVLRDSLNLDKHGVMVAGGKGLKSKRTPDELRSTLISYGFDEGMVEYLLRASRLSAKVDNALVQDGYELYHHTIFIDEKGKWAVVQQGMNVSEGYARRYHWLGEAVKNFVVEPHSSIVSDGVSSVVLNMTSRKCEDARKVSVDLVCESPSKVIRMFNNLNKQESLTRWLDEGTDAMVIEKTPAYLRMPKTINWNLLRKVYELKPRNYEELVEIRGVGPSTVRALALIATLIFGAEIDWRDPVKYSFAVGGKDGVPYPVSRRTMDEVTNFLREMIEAAELEKASKIEALKRLARAEQTTVLEFAGD
ncbi:MAG: DUF763 domain-containing protein [Nitrososphaerota archaeon]